MSLHRFFNEQADWSEETFGPTSARGPIGPLKHLVKETTQELLGVEIVETRPIEGGNLNDLEEYADLLFLVFDATRRAGFRYDQLTEKCFEKLEINKARRWPDWRNLHDAPVEHIK